MAEHLSVTGFFGRQAQGSKGTAATGTMLGFGSGSGQLAQESNNINARVIGSAAIHQQKGGAALGTWNFDFDHIHDATTLNLAARTAGALPWFTVSGGYDESSDVRWQMRDCHVNTLNVRLAGGETLSGSISGMGHKVVEDTTAEAITDHSEFPFMSYEAIFTFDGNAFEITEFDFSLNNNLQPRYVISGASRTANEKRFWDYLTPGVVDVSGTLRRLESWGTSVLADCPTVTSACVLRLVNCNGSGIIDIALTNTMFGGQTQDNPNEGPILYELPFVSQSVAITAA